MGFFNYEITMNCQYNFTSLSLPISTDEVFKSMKLKKSINSITQLWKVMQPQPRMTKNTMRYGKEQTENNQNFFR